MIGRFKFFCLSSLRLLLQHLSSLSMFSLQELVVSDGISEIKLEFGVAFLFVKKLFKLSIKSLAKIRFPNSSKCKPSRKRRDEGMLLLSMKTNELSQHILKMCWFTLDISACQFIVNNNSRD